MPSRALTYLLVQFDLAKQLETGWLADLIYVDGGFQAGLALFADRNGRLTRLSTEPSELAKALRLPGRAILPGLVNVHSHTFQRVIRGRTEHRTTATRDTFWTWREAMYHAASLLSPQDIYHAARMAFLEMLLSGITTVGEFHYLHHSPGGVPYQDRNLLGFEILRAAQEIGLRIVLLRSAYVRSGWRKPRDPGQSRFITPRVENFIEDTNQLRAMLSRLAKPDLVSVGVAPHSIRAVPLDYLRDVVLDARASEMPIHMHVAEQPAEIDACLAEYGLRPVELLHREGILCRRFTAIHAIHITPAEANLLGDAKSFVCACPTSERNLGDGAVPADSLLDTGARMCFGSDSNVQIDLLEDSRELEYHLRMNKLERAVLSDEPGLEVLARRLFEAATKAGADSLQTRSGALTPGHAADFFTVDLNDPSLAGASSTTLLSHIIFSLERTAIRDVCVNGEFVVENAHHLLQEDIVRDFASVQQRIWSL